MTQEEKMLANYTAERVSTLLNNPDFIRGYEEWLAQKKMEEKSK